MNDDRHLISKTVDAALDHAFLWFGTLTFVAATVMVLVIAIGAAITGLV